MNQDELLPTGIETFEAVKVVIEAILQDNGITKNSKRKFSKKSMSWVVKVVTILKNLLSIFLVFFDGETTTSRPRTTEQSALHLVKSQTTSTPPTMNINFSVTNMLDINVQPPLPTVDSNFLQRVSTQTSTQPTEYTTQPERTTPETTRSFQTETRTTISSTRETSPTTQETSPSTRGTLPTTIETSTALWPPTPPSAPMRAIQFPVSVAAVISIINQTEVPKTEEFAPTTTQRVETTLSDELLAQGLTLTQRQQLSEELLRKQLCEFWFSGEKVFVL